MRLKLLTIRFIFVSLLGITFMFLPSCSSKADDSSTGSSNGDETPPPGYKRGLVCRDCSGTGVYDHDVYPYVKKGGRCAGCMGKGYTWTRIEGSSIIGQSNDYNTTQSSSSYETNIVPMSTANAVDSVTSFNREPNLKAEEDSTNKHVVSSNELNKRRYFTGNVGKLSASYNLVSGENGVMSGNYFYDKRPNKKYTLQGKIDESGGLILIEYTDGKESAKCHLNLIEGCYIGVMNNTDGRNFFMKMCE